ncbi:MAG: gliding motility-associated C-terminal domain-containing protein [Bacteroidales bacterium]|nr:gliding motility-associated C-terminal domain-containing protein [Bacteroidales bacterium]
MNFSGIGQVIPDPLDPPIVKEVSVMEGTGNVMIRWKLQDSGDVVIRRWDHTIYGPGYNPITEIKDTSITEYIDYSAEADTKSRLYVLVAYEGLNVGTAIDSERFPSNLLSYEYDSCKSEILLRWINRESTFPTSTLVEFTNYEIYLKENGGEYQLVDSTREQNYTITGIKEKTNYTFYIAAIPEHAPNSRSTSNTISFYSEMAQAPAYINAEKASVSSGVINIVFEVDPNSELTKYNLVRSTSLTGQFDTIQRIDELKKSISLYDSKVNTDKNVYYYKLIALNNCGKPVMESDIINTIHLTVTNIDNTNNLEWNSLKEATNPASNYKIYRSIGSDSPQQIWALINNETSYQDNIEDLIGTNAGSKICYFVVAQETASQQPPNNSNIACATIEPKIYIPDAFIPNYTEIEGRDKFYIKFSFLPEDYKIIIYNRWSNVVFESSDPQESWDGRSLNGNLVPSGAYIYYIKIVTQSNQTIEKRGNITVIYP